MFSPIGAALRRWRRRLSRAEWAVGHLRLARTTAPSHAPGLLMIQIDGLGRRQLETALQRGRMPFLARLLRHHGYTPSTFYSGLPASTPAVQAELFYGVRTAVPAFSFLDPRATGLGMMMYPEWAKRIEADLAATGAEGLLKGGSSWSNIYTGGATQRESHFCGASIGLGDMWRTGKIRNIILFIFLHVGSVLRLLALLPIEFFISLWDAIRGLLRGQSWRRELVFIFARVFVCIGLRELITVGTKIDLARGLPIIHVNFLGYDEQSHRRGPSSAFAHWTLLGIDRAIRDLHRAARRSEGRDYEVWIFSDHGQARAHSLRLDVPGGLEGLMLRHWPGLVDADRRPPRKPEPTQTHASLLGGPGRNRREARYRERAKLTAFQEREFVVTAMGPVGHIYFKRALAEEEVQTLIKNLLADGVPGILRTAGDHVRWHTKEGVCTLPHDTHLLRGPEQLLPELAQDLADLVRHRFAGDLVAVGWHPDLPVITFADEAGTHCGASPDEIQGFLLLPPASRHLVDKPVVRPAMLREAALRHLGRGTRATPARRAKPAVPQPRVQLRVVTYNVHHCRGLDGKFAPDRIVRVLRDLDPDIVALQELESGRTRSRHEDQLAAIAEELGLRACFCPAIEQDGERYGHAILAREDVVLKKRARLPAGGRMFPEPREALAVTVKVLDQEILVVGTHLGLAAAERAAQIDHLVTPDWLGGVPADQPAIFLGDLNLVPGGSLYRRLVAPWQQPNGVATFRDVQAHAPSHVACKTFPSFLPVRTLDHIFVTPQFDVVHVHTPVNQLTRRASDHLPLVADLTLRI